MAKKDLNASMTELTVLVKSYLKSYSKLMKLEALEKFSRVGTFVVSSVIILVVAGFAVLFLTFAFSYWYGRTYDNYVGGFLIVSGFYIFIALVVFFLRRFIIGWPLIRALARIMFSEDKKEEEDE